MNLYDDANRTGKEAMDNLLKSFSAMTTGFQRIAAETTDYTRQSIEQSSQAFEKLAQSKSLDSAFEVQSDYAKAAYERWVAQTTKMSEMCSGIAKDAYGPFETAMSNVAARGTEQARAAV